MNNGLFDSLLKKNIINKESILLIKFYSKGLDGYLTQQVIDNFKFLSKIKNDKILVERIVSNIKYKIDISSIIAIDGMKPEKLASIFNIKGNGTCSIQKIDTVTGLPVKRGRKKKIRQEICQIS